MNPSIGLGYVVSDANKLDYCLEQSLLSFGQVADQICIILGKCDDDTDQIIFNAQKQLPNVDFKIRIINLSFDRKWQQRHRTEVWKMCDTDWVWSVDADEIFHEKHVDQLKRLVNEEKSGFINFKYNHYYGLPHWVNRNKTWYQTQTRLWHQSKQVQCYDETGCACVYRAKDGDGLNHRGNKTSIVIHHYGHVRDARVAGKKKVRFNGWYKDNNKTAKGYLPDTVSFEYGVPELGYPAPFFERVASSVHPKAALSWLARKIYIKWLGEDSDDNITNYDVDNPLLSYVTNNI